MDWNYYLEQKEGEIVYEGYTNSQFFKNGSNWVMGERIALGKSQTSLTLKQDKDDQTYPVGIFVADVFDKNG